MVTGMIIALLNSFKEFACAMQRIRSVSFSLHETDFDPSISQDADAIVDPPEQAVIPQDQAVRQAQDAFQLVFQYGPKIELDHYIVYHARKMFHDVFIST